MRLAYQRGGCVQHEEVAVSLTCTIRRKSPNRPFPVLKLDGSVDSASTEKLDTVLNLLMDQGNSRIVVDLQGVNYVSSAGWRAFMGAVRATAEKRIDLLFVGMQATVQDVFDLLGLERVITVYDSVGAALRAHSVASNPES
jgi:anti-anti-sigma factor